MWAVAEIERRSGIVLRAGGHKGLIVRAFVDATEVEWGELIDGTSNKRSRYVHVVGHWNPRNMPHHAW